MEKLKEQIKKFGMVELIAFIIYIVIVLIIATNHECFEDEAQSWLIARDLNWIEIIQQMKYEGHSFLWHYILAPFAKLGFPVITQVYITSFFAIASAFIILKKSPFNKFTKILLIFSGGMIYFYSVIARPYCLIVFLLSCISVIYKEKEKHMYLYAILIALLANTHLIMLPTAALLALFFWGEKIIEIIKRRKDNPVEKSEKKKIFLSLLIVIAGISIYFVIGLCTIFNCDIINNFEKVSKIESINSVFKEIKRACLETMGSLYGNKWFRVPNYFKTVIGIAMLLCAIGTPRNVKQGIIFWAQLIFTLLIHALIWFIMPTRVYIIIFTLMFWIWNYKDDKQYKKNQKNNFFIEMALIIFIIISMPSAYKLAYQDIKENYSTGKITAKFINKNFPEDTCFICIDSQIQQPIVAYLPKDKYKFYLPNIKGFATFSTWDDEWNSFETKKDIHDYLDSLKAEFDNIYIISIKQYGSNIDGDVKITNIFSSEKDLMKNFYVKNEVYYIYNLD